MYKVLCTYNFVFLFDIVCVFWRPFVRETEHYRLLFFLDHSIMSLQEDAFYFLGIATVQSFV